MRNEGSLFTAIERNQNPYIIPTCALTLVLRLTAPLYRDHSSQLEAPTCSATLAIGRYSKFIPTVPNPPACGVKPPPSSISPANALERINSGATNMRPYVARGDCS